MGIMSMLHLCMIKETCVLTVKERYELGNNINSKVLAFAFGLSAEIERDLISQRTKEALAYRKAAGMQTVVFMEAELDEPGIIGAAMLPMAYVKE